MITVKLLKENSDPTRDITKKNGGIARTHNTRESMSWHGLGTGTTYHVVIVKYNTYVSNNSGRIPTRNLRFHPPARFTETVAHLVTAIPDVVAESSLLVARLEDHVGICAAVREIRFPRSI